MGNEIIAVIDIGSYKITAAIGSKYNGEWTITGYGESPCIGFKKDMIYDVKACVKCIQSALAQAESQVGIKVNQIFVGFSGGNITSTNKVASINIPQSQKFVNYKDVDLVTKACQQKISSQELEIIHTTTRDYAVDGSWGISDPIGKKCSRLDMEAHIIHGQANAVQNLYQALKQAEIHAAGVFFIPYVLAYQLLEPVEKEIGTILVDIGGSTTGLCWFHRGKPWMTYTIPIGSEHVTSDLAIGLRLPISDASEVKINYGLQEMDVIGEAVEITAKSTMHNRKVSSKLIRDIIEARLQEMVDWINFSIKEYGQGLKPAEMVITGGGSKLVGLEEFFSMSANMPVRKIDYNNHAEKLPIDAGISSTFMEYVADNLQKDCEQENKLLFNLKSSLKNVIDRFSS